jgi:HPt (histidine-containing phosphotransfer) domain-containing protein
MRDLLEEDFADLIQVYITDSQQRVNALRVAQQENDNANGFEVAHALKGASANLGTTHLTNLSSQLQERCRERLISEQAALIENIAVALQRAEQEINLRLGL